MNIRKGVKLIEEIVGNGDIVKRQQRYLMSMRITLNRGDVVRHPERCLSHGFDEYSKTEDDGFFLHTARVDRENLVAGIFYALQGMNVGGYRKVTIAPHLAYGKEGVPNIIPPNAKLTIEIKVLKKI